MENFKEQQPQIEGTLGQHINDFAQQLVDMASEKSAEVTGTFNGIDLTAKPDTTVKDLILEFQRRTKQYRESP